MNLVRWFPHLHSINAGESSHEFLHFQSSDRSSLGPDVRRNSQWSLVATVTVAEGVVMKSARALNRRNFCGAAATAAAASPFGLSGFLFSPRSTAMNANVQ